MKEDGKYLRLIGYLFFSVIGFIAALLIITISLRLFFGLLSFIPWLTYIYVLFILSVPASVFISVFVIFFRRTKYHSNKFIKICSQIVFVAFILSWIYVYITDMIFFYKNEKSDIEPYLSYNTLYLAINVAAIFIMGVIQALTSAKEVDWMEKHREIRN